MVDYWRYVKPDPDGLEDNHFINPPKENEKSKPPKGNGSNKNGSVKATVLSLDDFLELKNIDCVDSKGVVFEHYDRLLVRKDIERDPNNSDNKKNQFSFTPYDAIVHFEGQGLFLPSFALSCNILALLYANKSDADVAKVLMQYKDKGNGYGWHAQNTLVDWSAKKIIHYPSKADYASVGGSVDINAKMLRKPLDFDNGGFSDVALKEALKITNYAAFLKNLTGLSNPEVFVEIGVYFGKPAKSFVSSSGVTRAAWLGCGILNFGLDTGYNLDDNSAARGVRSSPR